MTPGFKKLDASTQSKLINHLVDRAKKHYPAPDRNLTAIINEMHPEDLGSNNGQPWTDKAWANREGAQAKALANYATNLPKLTEQKPPAPKKS
jgi:hypothetical protein